MKEKKVALIYWGRRGGGAKLFLDTFDDLNSIYKLDKIYLSARQEILSKVRVSNEVQKIPFRPFLPTWSAGFFIPCWIQAKKYKSNFSDLQGINHVVIMSSPWDSFFRMKNNFKLWRVIHDAKPHPGDFWPTRFRINKWCRTSNVITLSNYVASKLRVQSITASLQQEVIFSNKKNLGEYLLIIGRLKKYKNIEQTIETFRKSTEMRIIVAGQGSNRYKAENVEVIDRWISDEEFDDLIRNAFATLCTYSEASQSGVVEESLRRQTPVIGISRGALPEQIRDSIDGALINNLTPSSVRIALKTIQDLDISRVGTLRKNTTLAQAIVSII